MNKNYYLKHDAPSFTNPKLAMLIQEEGARGYGVYWLLLEMLRMQNDFSLPETMFGALARQIGTQKRIVIRVVRNYGLFINRNGVFYSAGLCKRMENYLLIRDKMSQQLPHSSDANSLIFSLSPAQNVRATEQNKIEENNNSSRRRDFPPENEVEISAGGQRPSEVFRVESWESLVDEMCTGKEWMDRVGMNSGLGSLYIENRERIVALFKDHIRLYDKGGGLLRLSDVRQYFVNYLSPGSITCKKVRATLMQEQAGAAEEHPEYLYRFETRIKGRRFYMGRPIPDDAPPRPGIMAVWDEYGKKWIV